MSVLASRVLPYVAERHDVTYVTAGEDVPSGPIRRVVRGRRYRYMNLSGFHLSRSVNSLYRRGEIDLAVVWASIGFGLRGVPFINLEGGSVFREIQLFSQRVSPLRRITFLPGFLHYAVPEILCNRRALSVVVPTEALKADLQRVHHLPDARVHVVPHGVEPRHIALYPREGRRMDGPTKILFAGRLHFRKGIADVVEEFARRPEIRAELWLAGEGPDHDRIAAAVAGDPRIRLLGHLSPQDLDHALAESQIFVFPTLYEGFGLALSEAMASGHACVAYDLPVVREVLGDTGWYVPVGDARGMIDRLAELLRRPDEIERLIESAHRRAARFSWQDAAVEIERIISESGANVRSQSSA